MTNYSRFLVSVTALLLSMACVPVANGQAEPKQPPVLVLLHFRLDDHVSSGLGEDRIFRLIGLIRTLRKDYPNFPVSVACEFSGTVAQQLSGTPTGQSYLKSLKSLAEAGAIEFGYIGENEPTYRNRPRPALNGTVTPQQRWLEETNAAARFLTDYKDPLTGQSDAKRTGGLRQVADTFGPPALFGPFPATIGGEAPYYHQLRRMGFQAVMPGFPDPYFTMNIHGYRASVVELGAKGLAPTPQVSSEVFWDTNFLRLSSTSTPDIRRFQADDGKEALAKLLEKLDRSHVRVLQIEVAGYSRYLSLWPDGTPKMHPLTWAYDHPDDPVVPSGIKAYNDMKTVIGGYAKEAEALRWLLGEFLPANSGSRIVSAQEILRMAKTPLNSVVSAGTLQEALHDWVGRTNATVNMPATFVQARGNYFSSADLFQMLVNSLAEYERNGKFPEQVKLTHIYGPARLIEPAESAPTAVIRGSDIIRTAAALAAGLSDQTWRPVPSNAVPSQVEIAGRRVNPSQFLALMVETYLAGSANTQVRLRYLAPATSPGYLFPRQNPNSEGGQIWTLRPAPLDLRASPPLSQAGTGTH